MQSSPQRYHNGMYCTIYKMNTNIRKGRMLNNRTKNVVFVTVFKYLNHYLNGRYNIPSKYNELTLILGSPSSVKSYNEKSSALLIVLSWREHPYYWSILSCSRSWMLISAVINWIYLKYRECRFAKKFFIDINWYNQYTAIKCLWQIRNTT